MPIHNKLFFFCRSFSSINSLCASIKFALGVDDSCKEEISHSGSSGLQRSFLLTRSRDDHASVQQNNPGWAQSNSSAQLSRPTVKVFRWRRKGECWDFINRMLIVCHVRRLRASYCATFGLRINTKQCRNEKPFGISLAVRTFSSDDVFSYDNGELNHALNKLKVNRSVGSGCVKSKTKRENV